MNEQLKDEFLRYCRDFGYEPTRFPTSRRDPAVEKTHYISHNDLTEEQWNRVEASLDEFGYQWAIDEIRQSDLVSDHYIDRVFMGEFPTGEFNARCRRARYGYLCLFNRGLRNFIFQFSMATGFTLFDADKVIDASRGAEHPERNALDGVIYPLQVCLLYLKDAPPFSPRYPHQHFSGKSKKFAGDLSSAMRLFVVAHEIAHIQLGHTDTASSKLLPTLDKKARYLVNAPEREYEADRLAQEILIDIAKKQNKGMGITCGGICAFTLHLILNLTEEKILGKTPKDSKTHPDSESRRSMLVPFLREKLSSKDFQAQILFQSVFESIRLKITEMDFRWQGKDLTVLCPKNNRDNK